MSLKRFSKYFTRITNTLIIISIVSFLFRGAIYRACVKYENNGARKSYIVDDKQFSNYLDLYLPEEKFSDIHVISDLSQELASNILSYSSDISETNPNKLYHTGKATCVGYATLTAAIANYLLNKGDNMGWEAIPVKGKLYLFGINIHQYTGNNKMFKDHDFVIFRNKESNTEIYVDPTVNDYIWVNKVSKR